MLCQLHHFLSNDPCNNKKINKDISQCGGIVRLRFLFLLPLWRKHAETIHLITLQAFSTPSEGHSLPFLLQQFPFYIPGPDLSEHSFTQKPWIMKRSCPSVPTGSCAVLTRKGGTCTAQVIGSYIGLMWLVWWWSWKHTRTCTHTAGSWPYYINA